MNQTINCPSCGAALPQRLLAAKMLVCSYCGETSFLNANRWELAGAGKAVLADYGSMFAVGRRGLLDKKPFTVAGRLRLSYHGGFWDEWLLLFDNDAPGWLQEDEGNLTLFKEAKHVAEAHLPAYEGLRVGETIGVGGLDFFIMEKNPLKIVGGEGELPFRVVPGQAGAYAEGVAKGQPLSLEYLPGEVSFNLGTPLRWKDFTWEQQAQYV
jgi:Domain of unknown function (DUF4178)